MLRKALERRYKDLTKQIEGRYEAAENAQAELDRDDLDFADKFAELEEKKLRLRALEFRASVSLPSGEICPPCWLDRGAVHPIKPIDSRDDECDLFRCRECGTEIGIPVSR